jgi:catecholate siderophore receptor
MALGALAAYSANAQSPHPLNPASTTGGTGPHYAQQQRTLPVRRFDIPPGPLDVVAQAFEHATGIQLDVTDPSLRAISSPGVSGLYTDDEALKRMLQGTGLRYKFVGPVNVLVELAGLTSSVTVTDSAAAVPSSPKFTASLLDTPQTINTVSKQVIADQGATTLRDTLRNFAGISIAAGEGGAQGDNLTIRGFTARNDIFLDGMRDFGSYYRDPFNLEEVQVLEGPSSITFGRGSTGGVVNQETKLPQLSKFLSGSLQFGTDQTKRLTADINTPVHPLGDGAAFRLNVMGDEGHIAGRDIAENRRFGVAPSLALGLGTATRWTFSYLHQTADDIPDYGLPWLFNGPAPVNRRNFYGFRNSDFLRTYDDIGTFKVEHDVNAHLTVRNVVRYANYVRDVKISEPKIAGTITLDTPLETMQIAPNEIAVNSTETALDEQLDVTAHVETGAVQHIIVFGAEGIRETSDPTRFSYANVPSTSLLNPDEDRPFTGIPSIRSIVKTTAVTGAAYALDDVKLGRHWEVTGGFRFDRFGADYKQTSAPVSAFSRVDLLPSWRGAIVYKPSGKGSFYVSSGSSFNPSAESLSLSAGTADLPPEKNITYEAGTKWELFSSKFSVRGAVFRTDKNNAREPDPNNPALNVLAGKERVNGFELNTSGRITDRWQMLLGYAHLDPKVISSNYYPQSVGLPLANVPANTFTFWNAYNVPWHRMDVGAGGQFIDSRTASSTAPFDPTTGLIKQVPSYWVFNAMVRYPLFERADLQANIYNIANRFYYDQLHPGHIIPGLGRYALIGINFKF